jgi:uroporphyrinogen decarboxylase
MSTNREWLERSLSRRETVPVPFNFTFTPPAREKLEKHYGTTTLEDALDLPLRTSSLKSIKPLYPTPSPSGGLLRDEYGVGWLVGAIDRGAPVAPCLPDPDLSRYRFPDSAAAYRYESISPWCEANRRNYTVVWIGDLWERATFMRGMENILLDVALNPMFVETLLRGIADYILETMNILFARFEFDGAFLSDDYGTQRSLVMSPADWRRLVKPRLAEIYSLAKAHGRTVFHHSCGNNYPIIGDLIDIGLDVLHPIQPEAMDIFRLKKEFGGRLTLCGGVRTQDFLPNATPAQVREEVRRLKSVMGEHGGYILEPGITLQADVPVENMAAMIEEAKIA